MCHLYESGQPLGPSGLGAGLAVFNEKGLSEALDWERGQAKYE